MSQLQAVPIGGGGAGANGATGAQGATGPAGPAGSDGAAGATGAAYSTSFPITAWATYTPVFNTGMGATNIVFVSRRVGSNLEFMGQFLKTLHAEASQPCYFTLGPSSSGLIGACYIPSGGASQWAVVGRFSINGGANSMGPNNRIMAFAGDTRICFAFWLAYGAPFNTILPTTSANMNAGGSPGDLISVKGSVPINGW